MNIRIVNDNINWIVDEIAKDYIANTRHTIVKNNQKVSWCMSFRHAHSIENVPGKKVITVHHLEPGKIPGFSHLFQTINSNYDLCIIPNKITKLEIKKHINIPTLVIPYWILTSRMEPKQTEEVNFLRKQIKNDDEILIGYFQKDSNGDSLEPKLSKGPDRFISIVKELKKDFNIKVLLSGFSRKYIIYNLEKNKIKFKYFPMYKNINALYDILDWYFVTSRVEGGPQAILETSYRNIKILSTDVGIASEVLHEDCICNNENDFIKMFSENIDRREHNLKVVKEKFLPTKLIPLIDDVLEKIC